ncbi:hypothetical protein N9X93_05440, partial [Alphaproteobacteria bacterium]|nr:hypothetical protein [Alphaproteobacteria bacterium]
MSSDLTITSLNLIEEGYKTFLVLEGGGLAISAADAAINLSFGNEERYTLDPEVAAGKEGDIRYHFNASNFQNDVFGYGGYGDIIDSKTPGYEHLSDGDFLLKFELKPGIVIPEIYVDWAEIYVSTRDYGTVLQQTEKRGLGVLDSGTIGISDVAPELTDLSFREIIDTEGGGTRFEISGAVSQAEGANTNNIVVTYNSGDTWDLEALIESHYIQEDGTFRFYENFWSADDASPEFTLLGGYVTDSSGNVSFFDETLSKPHDQINDIWGIYLSDEYNDDAFNITSAYVELGEFINIDIDHDYFEDSVTYTSVHSNWGDSVDWLSISSSGVLSGVVPDEFEHGGFSVEAVINIDGVDTNIWTNFVDFKALNALNQDDSMLDFGGDLWTNSRTNDSVLINTSKSDVEFDGNLIGGETIQLSDGSKYSMSELKSITDGNGLSVAGSFGDDYIDLSGLNEDSFSKVIYPFDFANMGVSPGNDTLIAVDFKVDWGLLVSGQELLYAGTLNASNYWENPMADSLLKTGDFDITFNGDGAVTFSDNANGFITDAQNISLVQTVVGAKTQVTGDPSSNIIVSGGGIVDIWAGSGVDSFIITTDVDPMISPQLSMLIHDYEEGEVIRILDTGVATADDFSSTIVSHDDGVSYQTEVVFNTGYHSYGSTITLDGAWRLNPIDFTSFLSDHGDAALSFDSIYIPKDINLDDLAKTIFGSGNDTFYGDIEDDYVETNGGADWIMAGAGDDMVIVNGTVLGTDKNPLDDRSNYVLIDTGTGNDIVNVTTDFVGEVQLVSGGGADTLVVEGEAASFSWGADKDNLVLTSADATLVLTNQMAYDENQVFSYVEFISVDPVTGEETSQIFQIDPNADPVEGGIVTLLGTDKDDTLEIEWDSGPASIAGLKGDDNINGGMSDDNLDGGEGDDLLFGNSGDDSLAGGEGEDLLAGDHGSDLLFGGFGDDVYKIDLEYDGFLDRAGYDNVVLNEDGTINYELSPETPWDDVIGGVDTITDDGGSDRIWITNFQPTLNPFDQYKEMLSIDSDGTLVMKWGWDAESPSSYQYTLKEGFDYQAFDPVTQAAQHNGGYVVTKSNVNSTSEQPTYTWPVFAEKWQAEDFYSNQYSGDVAPVVHKVTVDPSKVAHEDGSKGSALEQTRAETLEFWVPGPEGGFNEGVAPDFTSYPGMVNVADTLYYDSLNNEYHQGGDLSSLEEVGQHTKFDLGDIKTWPGFTDLPQATDPASPEVGTQEYFAEQFVLGNSDTYPSVGEMPFVEVINNNLVSMADLQNVVDGDYSGATNLYPADISNDNAELAQGFKVTDFAVKDEYGNWVNTIESIVFTSPTGEHRVVDKYGSGILDGKKSAYDSLTDALKDGYGTEYFLSPSGVVDLGTVRTPTGFNADGTPKGFKETNNWQGAETDKNFFLIANADMAGLNDSGLGFNGSTSDVSFTGDRDAVDPFTVLSNEIWMSGAAKKDIMVGHDGWDYVDVMFGHGGDDSMMAEGGENYVIGGAGADKFIIEAKGQQTTIYGDHVDVNSDSTDVEYDNNGNTVTTNDSYGDAVFFDFAWPALIPNPNYDPNGPVDAINNPEMIRDGDTYIEQLGNNHFKVHHKLDNGEEINVEMYDVEGAYFSDGMGGIEYHALTTGRPITSDDFGKLDYEKNDVKFWVEHDDADYGGATTIAVVTTATKSITDPVTKQKISYEEPTVKW